MQDVQRTSRKPSEHLMWAQLRAVSRGISIRGIQMKKKKSWDLFFCIDKIIVLTGVFVAFIQQNIKNAGLLIGVLLECDAFSKVSYF